MIQPDREGMQLFLVVSHEKEYGEFYQAVSPLSLAMVDEAELNPQVPSDLGSYQQLSRIRYSLKHQKTRIVFILFPKDHPENHTEVMLYYPYLLETRGVDVETRRDVIILVVNMTSTR